MFLDHTGTGGCGAYDDRGTDEEYLSILFDEELKDPRTKHQEPNKLKNKKSKQNPAELGFPFRSRLILFNFSFNDLYK